MKADDYVKLYAETVGKKVSYKLKPSHILNFHAVLGACLKDQYVPRGGTDVDLRIHPFVIRPSGSGKALVYDLAEELAEKVGLIWVTRNKITEAGLIGTIRSHKGEQILIYGDAYNCDIIGFTEASLLLKDTNLCKNFNTLMDRKGVVSRKLAIGEITYRTRATVVLSSFPNRLVYDHLQTGFMQRCTVYYERLPLRYYREVMEWLAKKYGHDSRPRVARELAKIADRLKLIREYEFKFDLNGDAEKAMFTLGENFEKMVKPYPYFTGEVLKTFGTRWSEQILKLASHHAALELRGQLTKRDVDYGLRIGLGNLRSVSAFINDYYIKDKNYRRLEKQLEKFKEKRKTVKLSALARNLKPIKVTQIEAMLDAYEARGELKVDHKGRKVVFL